MLKKIKQALKNISKKILEYISTNRLFISFVILSLIMTVLIRFFTVGTSYGFKPVIVDLALIFLIGAFGYLIKPNHQFRYYFTWMIILTILCIVNSVYYTFYMSFASFGLLSTISQIGEVTGSLVEKFKFTDFIYLFFPLFFFYIHKMLNKTTYYNMIAKVEKGKKMFAGTLVLSVVLLCLTIVTLSSADYSRLSKMWYREYVVNRFGIILYQSDDLIQNLSPKISAMFGYDEAARKFREFYGKLFAEREQNKKTNKYTNILKGKNVVFVHMESMQTFFVDLKINNTEVTPVLNKLSKEGMYFSEFYPQISTGTSSDTEFTLSTSMMPVLSGTVFVRYYDRHYVSIQRLLKEQGYYVYSTHGNKGSMWNRDKMYPTLGYDDYYEKESFDINDKNTLGLGISDQDFFKQVIPKMEKIEKSNKNYMGTVITLSNHSPFTATKSGNPDLYYTYGKLDLTNTFTKIDEKTNEEVTIKDDYLEGTKLGNYIHSVHYADAAMGEFIDMIKKSDCFNDTVFVFYGDHDAKLSAKEYEYFYNYDLKTGNILTERDNGYHKYDYYQHELNKKTPLIMWTKNKELSAKLKGKQTNVMGMYDILPTISNMMGIESKYALGHDIFNIKDKNVVVFPNGNFVTNKVYYNNSESTHYVRNIGTEIEENYISELKEYAEEILEVSNSTIVHDLIKKEGDKITPIYENKNQKNR